MNVMVAPKEGMRMETQHNLTAQERKEKIFAWMRANGHTYESIGQSLGITGTGVSLMFTRATIPTRRYNQLRTVGVPPQLLPPAKDIPTGPKPRH